MARLNPLPWISIAAISAALAVAGGQVARAESTEAEALFTDATKLMKQGKTAQACDAYEASNRIEPRAGTLILLGECREKNKQLASAWSAYKDALTRVKDPRKHKVAVAKIAQVEPRLSYLTVSVTGSSKVAGLSVSRNGNPLDAGLWGLAVPIDGGDYDLAASAPGFKDWSTHVKVPIEGGKLSVEVPPLEALPKPVVAAHPDTPVVEAPRDDGSPPAAHGSFTGKRKAAVAIGVVGAGAVILGAVLGSSAKSKRSDASMLCPDPAVACAQAAAANALEDSAHSRALGADIAFVVGGVAIAAAATLWFTGSPESSPHHVAVVPAASTSGGGVFVVGRF